MQREIIVKEGLLYTMERGAMNVDLSVSFEN
jgi:hypothetical protein